MACRENRGGKVWLCLGLFVAASSFCNCTEPIRIQTPNTSVVRTLQTRENSTLNQGQGKGDGSGDVHHGRLLIGRKSLQSAKLKGVKLLKNLLDVHSDYQSDMGWEQPQHLKGQDDGSVRPDSAAVQRLLQMDPKVECTGNSMQLEVQKADSTPGSLFFVDRGSRLSPLPLSRLPSSCGYTLRSSRRDLVLVAPYDGCFVALEEDSYVLPLRLCGVPVRMSCPVMKLPSPNPPMVTCHADGMVVKTEWTMSVSKIKVKLNSNWEPLLTVSPKCGFSVVVHPEGVVISARYAPCMEIKDGMLTMELDGDGEIKVSCPSLSPLHPKPTQSPAKSPNQQTETPDKVVYPSYTWTPPPVPSTHAHQNPELPPQPAMPQIPVYPQYPENLTTTHTPKDINPPPQQPQEPYFPFYPDPFYPYPVNPDIPTTSTPIVQPLPSHITKKPDSLQPQQAATRPMFTPTPEGQMHQSYPFPFYPGPAQTEDLAPGGEPTLKPQATQHPEGQEQPLYPYPSYVQPYNPDAYPALPDQNPDLHPLPTIQPLVVQPPNGQKQPSYPHPFYPQPPKHETLPTQKPAEPFHSYPVYPLPRPSEKPAQSPVTQFGGDEHQPYHPFYPHPFYPQPPATTSEAPWNQEQQPLYPLYPEASKPEAPENPSPGRLPGPGSQERPLYPFPFYTQPPNPPFSKAPWDQGHHPFYPNLHPHYPHTDIEAQPTKNPASFPQSPATETHNSQEFQHFYPQPSQIPKPAEFPIKNPVPDAEPLATSAPKGQVHPPNQYYSYPQQPQNPQPLLPPALTPQEPQQVTPGNTQKIQEPANLQPSNPGLLPHYPQPGTPYIPPVHCPQICPSGFSNCCPQIAFHQHHHHIIPPGSEGKGVLPMYPGLPFLPAVGYSSFGYGLEPAPLPHKPMKAPAPDVQRFGEYQSQIAPQLPQLGSQTKLQLHLQPPDGHPAALPGGYPNKFTNPDLPVHPYFVPYNSQYPKWLPQPQDEKPPNFPHSLSLDHSNTHSKPQDAVSDPIKPVLHNYELYNIQPPQQQYGQLSSGMNNPTQPESPMKPNFMSYVTQDLQQQKNKMTAKDLQPRGKKSSDSKPLMHQDQSESLVHPLIPYYMLQDYQAPLYNTSTSEPNNSSKPQLHVSDSKKSSKPERQVRSHFEPNGYVLLQRGPPGREPSSSPEFPMPFKELVRSTSKFLKSKPLQGHSGKSQQHQNLKQPHGEPLYPKHLGKGIYGPLPENDNHMPSPMGEESTKGLPLYNSAPSGLHPASLPREHSLNRTHLMPKFPESSKDFWKPITPLGSSHRIPLHDPGHSSRKQDSATHQANGLPKQPIQREGGQQKQKESFTENK